MIALHLAGDPAADALISADPFALLVGMLLDQQVTMEVAFSGPLKVQQRLGTLTPAAVAAVDSDEFVRLCRERPAVHRFPGAMAARMQTLAVAIRDEWDGRAAALWERDDPDGATALRRLAGLPGFGRQKAAIFLALLGKQCGLEAPGWREAAGEFGTAGTFRSVADIVDADSLARVRAHKQAIKAAAH